MKLNFPEIALHVPTILLPAKDVKLETWSVIACDQYTSEPEYWDRVYKDVGNAPSTLRLIFPEVYLESKDHNEVVKEINVHMEEYLNDGLLRTLPPGFVAVNRKLGSGKSRRGLIVALDLEHYDYREGARELIRTTEGTVLARLPPRIEVRAKARIEIPHIMVLINDPEYTVIDPLFGKCSEPLYEGELMGEGGSVKGYHIGDVSQIDSVVSSLFKLSENTPNMLYAMGDGNHSFATAKAVWENIKKKAEGNDIDVMQHPARYALVELVNLHDSGLDFEPIHRAVFGIDIEPLMDAAARYFSNQEFTWGYQTKDQQLGGQGHRIEFCSGGSKGWIRVGRTNSELVVATLQSFLDDLTKVNKSVTIDYIHGENSLENLSNKKKCIGFYLPKIEKKLFFEAIAKDGPLPRKTFSMGEAEDKRYYVEARAINL